MCGRNEQVRNERLGNEPRVCASLQLCFCSRVFAVSHVFRTGYRATHLRSVSISWPAVYFGRALILEKGDQWLAVRCLLQCYFGGYDDTCCWFRCAPDDTHHVFRRATLAGHHDDIVFGVLVTLCLVFVIYCVRASSPGKSFVIY
jgi:hypothetical protein